MSCFALIAKTVDKGIKERNKKGAESENGLVAAKTSRVRVKRGYFYTDESAKWTIIADLRLRRSDWRSRKADQRPCTTNQGLCTTDKRLRCADEFVRIDDRRLRNSDEGLRDCDGTQLTSDELLRRGDEGPRRGDDGLRNAARRLLGDAAESDATPLEKRGSWFICRRLAETALTPLANWRSRRGRVVAGRR